MVSYQHSYIVLMLCHHHILLLVHCIIQAHICFNCCLYIFYVVSCSNPVLGLIVFKCDFMFQLV